MGWLAGWVLRFFSAFPLGCRLQVLCNQERSAPKEPQK